MKEQATILCQEQKLPLRLNSIKKGDACLTCSANLNDDMSIPGFFPAFEIRILCRKLLKKSITRLTQYRALQNTAMKLQLKKSEHKQGTCSDLPVVMAL